MNVLPVLAVALGAHLWVQALEGNSGDVHSAPHGHWTKQADVFLYRTQRPQQRAFDAIFSQGGCEIKLLTTDGERAPGRRYYF